MARFGLKLGAASLDAVILLSGSDEMLTKDVGTPQLARFTQQAQSIRRHSQSSLLCLPSAIVTNKATEAV